MNKSNPCRPPFNDLEWASGDVLLAWCVGMVGCGPIYGVVCEGKIDFLLYLLSQGREFRPRFPYYPAKFVRSYVYLCALATLCVGRKGSRALKAMELTLCIFFPLYCCRPLLNFHSFFGARSAVDMGCQLMWRLFTSELNSLRESESIAAIYLQR
jgi:hypothetical protein